MFYFFKFCFIAVRFAIRLLRVRKKAQQQATEYLHALEEKFSGKFDDATFSKVVKSHSLYLSIVNDAFTLLHGRTTTAIEQERSINYFICSSVFDNFFDDKILSLPEIESITFQSETYTPQRFDEKVSLQAHFFLMNGMKDKAEYIQVLRNVFEAQAASVKQFDESISNEEIKHITFEKGGNAVLMCRYYLDVVPTKAEEQCWYSLGTMIQLTNDLFDIYKDLQQNIQTLPVRCVDAYAMEEFYLLQVSKMKQQIEQLPYSKNRKQLFSITMAATYTIGLMPIYQLKKIQQNLPQLPPLRSLPRKALIVDMEKASNIFQWVKFIYKYGKLSAT